MQQIQLNIIPFTPNVDRLTFAFYGEKIPNATPIIWDKLFNEFPEGREKAKRYYFCDFEPPREGAIEKEIEFTKAVHFSNHYFSHLILQYFKSIEGAIVLPNYVDDVEVWFEDLSKHNSIYKIYNKFTLKVQYNYVVSKSFEMVIAYNGASKVLRKSIADLPDFDTQKYNLINCNGTIYKYDKIPEEIRQHP